MFSFGEELKRERERRGVDLGRIAQETNIPRRFLELIESGRVHSIPGRFYRRASIRAYAVQLGLAPDRFVAAYEFAVSGEAQAQAIASAQSGSSLAFASAIKWVAIGIVGLGLTGAAAAVWRRAPEARPSPLGQVAAFPSTGSRADAEPDVPSPFVEDELAVESPGPAIVRLTLTVNEPCWLEVSTDGERVTEGIMLRGFEKEFQAEEICFSLGNAGGVSYRIDDRVGKPLGQTGQVIKGVCVTRDNVLDFVDEQEEGSRVG
jgi:transcriptional regulator with XRE-family HTH domain